MTANAQEKYKTLKDITYISADDTSAYRRERCKLDINMPVGKKGFKTIVWFHGGGLEGGNKEFRPELMNSGIAQVAPNYRLFPRCKCPDYTRDAAAAVAWTIKHIAEYGVDADSIKGYFPVSGQCATHYTIRKERKISFTLPIVDNMSPLNNARKLGTNLTIITGDRRLEQMARYEENLYLKSVLEGMGNKYIPVHELSGFDHGTVLAPAGLMIRDIIRNDK